MLLPLLCDNFKASFAQTDLSRCVNDFIMMLLGIITTELLAKEKHLMSSIHCLVYMFSHSWTLQLSNMYTVFPNKIYVINGPLFIKAQKIYLNQSNFCSILILFGCIYEFCGSNYDILFWNLLGATVTLCFRTIWEQLWHLILELSCSSYDNLLKNTVTFLITY